MPAALSISSISPTSGPSNVSTEVIITGEGFTESSSPLVTTVYCDGQSATFNFVDDNTISTFARTGNPGDSFVFTVERSSDNATADSESFTLTPPSATISVSTDSSSSVFYGTSVAFTATVNTTTDSVITGTVSLQKNVGGATPIWETVSTDSVVSGATPTTATCTISTEIPFGVFETRMVYSGDDNNGSVASSTVSITGVDGDGGEDFIAAFDLCANDGVAPLVTFAYCPIDLADESLAPAPGMETDVADRFSQVLDLRLSSHVVIWDDMKFGMTWNRYQTLFNACKDKFTLTHPYVRVCGPNVLLKSGDTNVDIDGTLVDSDTLTILETFIEDVTFDGLAFSGLFQTADDWQNVLFYIQDLLQTNGKSNIPIVITNVFKGSSFNFDTRKAILQGIAEILGDGDIVIGGDINNLFYNPIPFPGSFAWNFKAKLNLPKQYTNVKLNFPSYSNDFMYDGVVYITSDGATPYEYTNDMPSPGRSLILGTLPAGLYNIEIYGDSLKSSSGNLKLSVSADGLSGIAISDTAYIKEN